MNGADGDYKGRSGAESSSIALDESLQRRLETLSADRRELAILLLEERGYPNLHDARGRAYPLSYSQERMWVLSQFDQGTSVYNVPGAVQVDGRLNLRALQEMFEALVRRHSVLRTTFHQDGESLTQRVHSSVQVPVHAMDLSGLGREAATIESGPITRQLLRQPFSLSKGPLLRVALIRLSADQHIVVFVMHHIVADGWSAGILMREMTTLYRALVAGESARLAPLPIEYGEFALWQRQPGQIAAQRKQLDYWRRQLFDAPPLHDLPLDRTRSPERAHVGRQHRFELSPAIAAAVGRLSRECCVTPFVVLSAGFRVLLGLYSGQHDIVIGTSVANRPRRDLEGLVGCFVNSLALRMRIDPRGSFVGAIREVHAVVSDALSHQDVPFEQVVEMLAPQRDPSYAPFFQVMFVLQNATLGEMVLPELVFRPLSIQPGTARYDLTLELSYRGDLLAASIEYDTHLFESSTIELMGTHYGRLLEALLHHPQSPMANLPLLSSEEGGVSPQSRREPGDRGVHAEIASWALAIPKTLALIHGGENISFDELERRSSLAAGVMSQRGLQEGSTIAIRISNPIAAVIAQLAAFKAGLTVMVLPRDLGGTDLAQWFDVHMVRTIVADDDGQFAARYGLGSTRWIELEEVSTNAQGLAGHAGATASVAGMWVCRTDGKAELVAFTHHALLAAAHEPGSERVLVMHSEDTTHSITEVWQVLSSGRTCVIGPDASDPEAVAQCLRDQAIGLVRMSGLLFNRLANEYPDSFSNLRGAMIGDGALSPHRVADLARRYPHLRLQRVFGACATDAAACRGEVHSGPVVLRSRAGMELWVLDEQCRPVAAGGQGQVFIGGDGLAQHLSNGASTAAWLIPHPRATVPGQRLCRTGREGRLMVDGGVKLLGRRCRISDSSGRVLDPMVIESALYEHAYISQALVTIGADGALAFVATRHELSVDALRDHLSVRLPAYHLPRSISIVPAIILQPEGTADVDALPMPKSVSRSRTGPEDGIERLLMQAWAEVLPSNEIGVDDDFFALGGDSIVAIQIVARLREHGLALMPKDLFQARTIASLARIAASRMAGAQFPGGDAGKTEGAGEYFPLSPIQREFFATTSGKDRSKYVQALLVDVPADISIQELRRASAWLCERHDALRLRFGAPDGEWAQRVDSMQESAQTFVELDLGMISREGYAKPAGELAANSWRLVDPIDGPIWRMVVLHRSGGDKQLLLVCHHLAIDAISWRIVLGELARVGTNIMELPPPRVSWRGWVAQLQQRAIDFTKVDSRGLWRTQMDMASKANALPPDTHEGRNLPGMETAAAMRRTQVCWLERRQTAGLLRRDSSTNETTIEDRLLYALAEVLANANGSSGLWVEVESHGREPAHAGSDVSSTVGWFTTSFPMFIACAKDAERACGEISARRTALREHAIEYSLLRAGAEPSIAAPPRAQVGFNYLGKLDGRSRFALAKAPAGEGGGWYWSTRVHDIDAAIVDGRLRLAWTFRSDLHASDEIARLQQDLLGRLHVLAALDDDGIEERYPLTPMQEGMLLHSVFASKTSAPQYLEQIGFTLHGELDAALLRQSWQLVVDRHPGMRTCFRWQDVREPEQWVRRSVVVDFCEHDWRDIARSPDEERRRWLAFLEENRLRGFALERAPASRIALIRLDETRHRCVWCFHHALLDGWSMSIVLQEVLELYGALKQGRAASFVSGPGVGAYLEWLKRQDQDCMKAYWRERLLGFVAPTPLPASVSTGEVGYDESRLLLSERTTARLRRWCRNQQLTMGTVALGLWAIVLGRYSGSEDVITGCTVSGRPSELRKSERMVGLFINTLPCRIHIDLRARAGEWLRDIQSEQAQARENGYLTLRDIHRCSEVEDGRALFESIVVFENYPIGIDSPPPGLQIDEVWVTEHASFPLVLVLLPGERLTLKAKFDRARFDDTGLREVLTHYSRLFDKLVADHDVTVSALAMVDPPELVDRLRMWDTATPTSVVTRWTHQLIERHSRSSPEAVAVVDATGTLNYRQLWRLVDAFSRRLTAAGVRAGDLIPLLCGPGAPAVVAILGIMQVGAAYVPLDPETPPLRLRDILSDTSASRAVCERALANRLPPELEHLCADDPIASDQDASATPPSRAMVHGDDLAYVLYTSGSTGTPKGVMVTHRGLTNYLLWCVDAYDMEGGVGAPLHSSLAFDLSVTSLLGPLVVGRAVHAFGRTNALESLIESLREGISFSLIKITPSHLELVERMLGAAAPAKPPTRIIIGGEALSGERLRYWRRHAPDTMIVNEYGPTETVVGCCMHEVPADRIGDGPVPIGRPVANTRLRIIDGQGRLKPIGATGELCIGGAGVARGYLGRPSATAERFVPDPFAVEPGARMYRSGDAAVIDANGVVHYRGRLDSQLKLRGYRVEPAEIERAILACEGIQQAAVCADARSDLHAFVVPAAGYAASGAEWEERLRRGLKARLADFMMPTHWHTLTELPLTRNGKVDITAMTRSIEVGVGVIETKVRKSPPARTPAGLQLFVAELWRRVLRRESIGLDDGFFDVGGHSLLLMRVQDELAEQLGTRVSMLDLFKHSTVRALAAHLREHLHCQAPAAATSPSAGAAAPVNPVARPGGKIAVVGMAGRFPGADSVEAFWKNLEEGIESITFFDDARLRAAGVSEELLSDPNYVRASGYLDNVDMFDGEFFGMSPREANILDPQHRLFLECAQQALDAAGYDPSRYPGDIGVYAGTFLSSYLIHHLAGNPQVTRSTDVLQLITSNDKDFLASRVSYKLGLRGPSVGVQSACSSSLAAVHMACRALRDHSCDMALAGGVSIRLPQVSGHLYQPGGVLSADGHCRAFDAAGTGFVGGSGCGIVVLRRLEDAVRDGDDILAVLHGSALNNDGAHKIGFSAPSSHGQSRVVRAALEDAGIAARSISYIEAHGTATSLGDPVEVDALKSVFAGVTGGTCAIGSVKTNIGHLDAAAGIAGLIKTLQQLLHRKIAASLNCPIPNPALGLDSSPFFVNERLREWQGVGGQRLACVNSFGMGGTNVSVVIGEAPGRERARQEDTSVWRSLLLSARTPEALFSSMRNLGDHLERNPESDMDDVAYTLAIGRRAFAYRRSIDCRTREEALRALRTQHDEITRIGTESDLIFVFGEIAPFLPEAILALCRDQPVFSAALERCAESARSAGTPDLLKSWKEGKTGLPPAMAGLTALAMQYAMCELWRHWGIRPDATLGIGVGALVAAIAAGALDLGDAMRIVLSANPCETECWNRVVVREASIPCALGEGGDWTVRQEGVQSWLRAAYQGRGDTASWRGAFSRRDAQTCVVLCDAAHLSKAVPDLFELPSPRRIWQSADVVEDGRAGCPRLLGHMWAAGINVDWTRVHAGRERRRVPLPPYPFQKRRHWVDPPVRPHAMPRADGRAEDGGRSVLARSDISAWFYLRGWEREEPIDAPAPAAAMGETLVLLRSVSSTCIRELLEELGTRGAQVVNVEDPASLERVDPQLRRLPVGNTAAFSKLLAHCGSVMPGLGRVLYLCNSASDAHPDDELRDVAALSVCARQHGIQRLTIVTRGAFDVSGEESLSPASAALLGLARVIPYEQPGQLCRLVDAGRGTDIVCLGNELSRNRNADLVAVRGSCVWLERYRRRELHPGSRPAFRRHGRYLIVGVGAVGAALARHLASEYQACLILVARGGSAKRQAAFVDELEACGARAEFAVADVADHQAMRAAFARGDDLYGGIDGILMAAGERVAGSLNDFDAIKWRSQLHASTEGLPVLAALTEGRDLDFCLLLSSLSSVVGLYGWPAYPAAHAYMEAFAQLFNRDASVRWTVIGMDNWETSQMQNSGLDPERMTCREGLEVIERVLGSGAGTWAISVSDLDVRRSTLARMQSLPAAEARRQDRTGSSNPYRAPRSALETAICGIWEECLGVPSPGVDDNFFELGGDSVASLQVLARCNDLGLHLTPRQILEYQTIAELAAAASRGGAQVAGSENFAGEAPLAPIQHWFFEQGVAKPEHWNQARRLRLRRRVPVPLLRNAVRRLIAHHEVLRSRYHQIDGVWRQSIVAADRVIPFNAVDFSLLAKPEYDLATEAVAESVQRSLCLQDGPLLRISLFQASEASEDELLVVMHHLVCDAWSWRILLEDLASLCDDSDAALTPTTAHRDWVTGLSVYADSVSDQHLDHWLKTIRSEVGALPIDKAEGHNQDTEGSLRSVTIEFSREVTAALHATARRASAGFNDVLIGALARAIGDWADVDRVLIEFEGLGRDAPIEGIDVSRTIGWFTSPYPVLFHTRGNDWHEMLAHVRERMSKVPDRGIGYGALRHLGGRGMARAGLAVAPRAQIGFVYLGHIEAASVSQQGLFAPSTGSIGTVRSPEARLPYRLAVNALIDEGALHIHLLYSERLYHAQTLQSLADRCRDAMLAFVGAG